MQRGQDWLRSEWVWDRAEFQIKFLWDWLTLSERKKNVDPFWAGMFAKVIPRMPECEGIHVIKKLCGEEWSKWIYIKRGH